MQYSQEHLKTIVYAKFGGQTECIMGNWKIENSVGKYQGEEASNSREIEATLKLLFLYNITN